MSKPFSHGGYSYSYHESFLNVEFFSNFPITDTIRDWFSGKKFFLNKRKADSRLQCRWYGATDVDLSTLVWVPDRGFLPPDQVTDWLSTSLSQDSRLVDFCRDLFSISNYGVTGNQYYRYLINYKNNHQSDFIDQFIGGVSLREFKTYKAPFVTFHYRGDLSPTDVDILTGKTPPPKVSQWSDIKYNHITPRLSECCWLPSYGYVPYISWREFLGSDFTEFKEMLTSSLRHKYPDLDLSEFRNLSGKINNLFHRDSSYVAHLNSTEYLQLRGSNSRGWRSQREHRIARWLSEQGITVLQSWRKIPNPDTGKLYELDIYLPEYNIGFEFNGLFWHSSLHLPSDYHSRKSDTFLSAGIPVYHFWEDMSDEDIKSRILDALCEKKLLSAKGLEFSFSPTDTIITTSLSKGSCVMCSATFCLDGNTLKLGTFYQNPAYQINSALLVLISKLASVFSFNTVLCRFDRDLYPTPPSYLFPRIEPSYSPPELRAGTLDFECYNSGFWVFSGFSVISYMKNDFDWNEPLTACMLACPDLETLYEVYDRWNVPKELRSEYTHRLLYKKLDELKEDLDSFMNTYRKTSVKFTEKLSAISSMLDAYEV